MLRKVLAIVGPAVFLVIARGFVAGLAPWWIFSAEAPRWIPRFTPWRGYPEA